MRLSDLLEAPPRGWPRFTSPLHSPAVVARVGRVLGIMFAVCFITGLISHYQYHPWHWLPVPATPAWGYRFTQGLHVITGIAILPLLLIKLWAVYPKLFAWPPARSALHAAERASVALLVATSLVEVVIGFLNILQWYPWRWSFVFVHYTLAYVAIGSILLHIAVKLPTIQDGLRTPLSTPVKSGGDVSAELPITAGGLSRRGLITATAAGTVIVVAATVGQVVTPLAPIALLAPRRPRSGPLGIPINRTAAQAGTARQAVDPSWQLAVRGPRPFTLNLAEVEALPATERHLPIACVEGWSISGRWRGVRLIDLVTRGGGHAGSRIEFTSLETNGPYGHSVLVGPQVAHALLATHLNGQRLTVDHGYPLRLIAPDHPGVFNTKWLQTITIR